MSNIICLTSVSFQLQTSRVAAECVIHCTIYLYFIYLFIYLFILYLFILFNVHLFNNRQALEISIIFKSCHEQNSHDFFVLLHKFAWEFAEDLEEGEVQWKTIHRVAPSVDDKQDTISVERNLIFNIDSGKNSSPIFWLINKYLRVTYRGEYCIGY